MFFKKKSNIDLINIISRLDSLEKKLKEQQELIEKVEIKALESQKVYRRKLKNLVGEEEEKDKDLNKSIFLSPNGNPI